ncbi:heterokaryon incompatibility protein-domain-containing protein [Phyllosticta citricarpa]
MSSSPFPYRPLQAQTQEIRIIQVLSLAEESHENPQVDSGIQRTLATKSIILDDRQIGVTANLEIALQQLARNLYDKREKLLDLWVDAICIDQANASEKTQQVSLMDQIYNNATQTIFWLGTASDDSNDAIECE